MAFLLKPYVKIMLQLAASGKTELKRRRRIALALVCLWDANDVYTSKTCTDFRRIVRKTGTLQPPFSTTLFTKQVLRQPTSPVSLPSIERGALTDPSKLAPELYALLPTFYVDAIRPGKDGNKMNWPQQISEACRNTSLPAGVQPLHAAYDVGKTQDDNEKRHRVSMEWPEFNKFYNYSKYMYGMEDTERNSYRNAYGSAYGYVPPQRRSSTFQFGNRGSISVPNPQRRSQFAQSSYNQSRTMPTSYGPPAYSSPSTQYPLGATVQGHNQHAMGGSDSYGQDQGFGGGYNYTQGRGQGGGGGFYNPGQGQGGGNGYGRGQGQGGGYNRGATGNFQPRGNHFHQGPGAYGGYNSRGGYSNQQGHGQGGNGRARLLRGILLGPQRSRTPISAVCRSMAPSSNRSGGRKRKRIPTVDSSNKTRRGSTRTRASQRPVIAGDWWEAKQILDEDGNSYLIDWEGTDPDSNLPYEPSWELKENVTDDLKAEWEDKKITKPEHIRDRARQSRSDRAAARSSRLSAPPNNASRSRRRVRTPTDTQSQVESNESRPPSSQGSHLHQQTPPAARPQVAVQVQQLADFDKSDYQYHSQLPPSLTASQRVASSHGTVSPHPPFVSFGIVPDSQSLLDSASYDPTTQASGQQSLEATSEATRTSSINGEIEGSSLPSTQSRDLTPASIPETDPILSSSTQGYSPEAQQEQDPIVDTSTPLAASIDQPVANPSPGQKEGSQQSQDRQSAPPSLRRPIGSQRVFYSLVRPRRLSESANRRTERLQDYVQEKRSSHQQRIHRVRSREATPVDNSSRASVADQPQQAATEHSAEQPSPEGLSTQEEEQHAQQSATEHPAEQPSPEILSTQEEEQHAQRIPVASYSGSGSVTDTLGISQDRIHPTTEQDHISLPIGVSSETSPESSQPSTTSNPSPGSSSPPPRVPSHPLGTLDSHPPPRLLATPNNTHSIGIMSSGQSERTWSPAMQKIRDKAVAAAAAAYAERRAQSMHPPSNTPVASISGTRSPSTIPDQSPQPQGPTPLREATVPDAIENAATLPRVEELAVPLVPTATLPPPPADPPAVAEHAVETSSIADDASDNMSLLSDEIELVQDEFIVPLQTNGRERAMYVDRIRHNQGLLTKAVKEYHPSMVKDLLPLVQSLKDIETHVDLVYAESQPASSSVGALTQMQWDEDSSTKFRFLGTLFEALRKQEMHLLLVVDEERDQLFDMLIKFCQAKSLQWSCPAKHCKSKMSDVDGKLQVTILASDSSPVVRPPTAAICLNGAIDAAQLRTKNWAQTPDGHEIPVLHLVIPRTLGHIDRFVPSVAQPGKRLHTILACLAQFYTTGDIGRSNKEIPDATSAAELVAAFLSAREQLPEEHMDWPLPSIGGIKEFVEYESQNTQHSAESPEPVPSASLKRPLDDVLDSDPSKRLRMTPHPGTTPENETTHISDSMPGTATEVSKLQEQLAEMQRMYEEARASMGLEKKRNKEWAKSVERGADMQDTLKREQLETTRKLTAANQQIQLLTQQKESLQARNEQKTESYNQIRAKFSEQQDMNLASEDQKVAALARLHQELDASKAAEAAAIRRAESDQKTLEYLREQYQTAERRVNELTAENASLSKEVTDLTHKADRTKVELNQLSMDQRFERTQNQRNVYKAENEVLKKRLQRVEEDNARLKASKGVGMGTRAQSVPRSPRVGSASRGASPAATVRDRVGALRGGSAK
ncbi:hypothetical protein EJ04DRAFT_529673 [Polyplosphaeria fusca]|uniref:Chromo domain-containing protein n=1 Tax=Polyplosphaeria fusca TaxID=682080 RepID=A0A9P4UUG7_9PLEO|nr:hypothetical protein EJ04DRAFT_529673 [Polyplosphaeria fusca]